MNKRPADPLILESIGDAIVAHFNWPEFMGDYPRETIRDRLIQLIDTEGCRKLWLDLGRVHFIDGGALAVFVSLWRRLHLAGGRLVLANLTSEIREVFSIVRLDGILDIRAGILEPDLSWPDPADDAFRQSIIAEPEDDAVRLIYADWIDDHGQPARADFIRTQCTLACLGAEDPRRLSLQQREQELLGRHGEDWTRALRPLVAAWQFQRGFVEEITLSWPALFDHGQELSTLTPVRRLRLRHGWWRNPAPLSTLLESSLLPGLIALDLNDNNVADEGTIALARSPNVVRLTTLGLRNNRLGDAAAAALTCSPWLNRLVHLDLRNNPFSDDVREDLRQRFGPIVVL